MFLEQDVEEPPPPSQLHLTPNYKGVISPCHCCLYLIKGWMEENDLKVSEGKMEVLLVSRKQELQTKVKFGYGRAVLSQK